MPRKKCGKGNYVNDIFGSMNGRPSINANLPKITSIVNTNLKPIIKKKGKKKGKKNY